MRKLSSVQLLSYVQLFATPWMAAPTAVHARQASLSITNSQSLLTHVHLVGDAIQPSHPLSSPSLPDFNLSQLLKDKYFVKVMQHSSSRHYFSVSRTKEWV